MDAPVIPASALRVRNNVLLNAFGGGFVTGVVDAMISSVVVAFSASDVLFSPPINVLIPRTDHAVVKRVKKNPPMMTANTLSTYLMHWMDKASHRNSRFGRGVQRNIEVNV